MRRPGGHVMGVIRIVMLHLWAFRCGRAHHYQTYSVSPPWRDIESPALLVKLVRRRFLATRSRRVFRLRDRRASLLVVFEIAVYISPCVAEA